MFESVTKRRKNPIVNMIGWSLIALVCLVFVFMGFSPDSSFLGRGGAAAEVNGDAISLREFKDMLDRLENQGTDRESQRKAQEDAVNILVNRSLIVQEANRWNIHVSDQEVAQELLSIEPFFEDGQFSRIRYKNYLRQMRLTEPEFEERIRRDLLIQKMSQLVSLVGKDVQVVDQFDKKIEQAQVNIAYVKLTPEDMKSKVQSEAVRQLVSKDEARLKTYFEAQAKRFQSPAQVRARHILLKAEEDDEAERAKALAKAEQIKKTLSPLNFKQLAQQHSDDPGSKSQGGDLGFFSQGKMVPEFEQAAFAAKPGDIVGPVETQFGYHLILVEEKKEAVNKEFAQVREEIAKDLLAKDKLDALVAELNQGLSSGQASQVEDVVARNRLQWTTTGFFSVTRENVPGVGNNAEFAELATSLSPSKEYPARVVFQGEAAYLMKFKGAKLSAPALASEQQMEFFKQLMRQQRVNGLVQSWADSLREKARIKVNAELLSGK